MKLISWSHSFLLVALLSANALSGAGCVGDIGAPVDDTVAGVDDEDVTSSEAALVKLNPIYTWDINHQNGLKEALNAINAQAASVGRTEMVDRGLAWFFNGDTTYDPYALYQGFRRDCSGFVSLCWGLTDNPSTKLFPPHNTKNPEKYGTLLPGGLDELAPGDAVNRTVFATTSDGRTTGHIMIFAGWAKPDHSEVYLLHHGGGKGKPVSIIQVRRERLVEYVAIRSVKEPLEPVVTETPGADGCTDTQRNNCGAFTCGCSNGTCVGGACSPKGADGCNDLERSNCGAFTCGCSNGACFGGACPGADGCTDAERGSCNASGTSCSNGKCNPVDPGPSAQPVTLHRLWNSNGDHFYTISSAQVDIALGQGYVLEDYLSVGECFAAATPDTVPLYRLWNPVIGDHFYTTNALERDAVVANNGYADEGVECWVYAAQAPSSCPLYRMYSQSMSDHFYTLSQTEVWNAASQGVYVLEEGSIAGYMHASSCPQ